MTVLVIAVGVLGAGLGHAWAGPRDRLDEAEGNLGQAQDALEESTQALADATSDYQAATAKLPAAQAALAGAQEAVQAAEHQVEVVRGQVVAARAADEAAANRLVEAEDKVEVQVVKIADVTGRIDGKRASISQVAVQAYQRGAGGDLASIAAVMQADSLQELATGIKASQSVVNAESVVLDDLKDDRAELANQRVVLEDLRAEAQQLRQEAAARLEETERRDQEAEAAEAAALTARESAASAKADVDNLIAARENAVSAAAAAKDEDAVQARAWAAERDKIQAQVDEIARREREERERREREREERERQERERDDDDSGDSDSDSDSDSDDSDSDSDSDDSDSGGSGGLNYPVSNPYITSPYGMRVHPVTGVYKLHDGTDFRAYCGTPIRASASGTVQWANYRNGYGNQVAVSHGGMVTTYSHLSRFAASPGESVAQGETIGYSGTTGSSTACHLHFMLYVNGSLTNPMNYL